MENILKKVRTLPRKYFRYFPYMAPPLRYVHTQKNMNIAKYSMLLLTICPCAWANQKKELEEVQKSESRVGDRNIISSTTNPP
jgi:GTP cyclohydrolase FolE2